MIALSYLAHLVGDYVLQSHVMAVRKTSSWAWAAIHAAFYSLPFAVLLALFGHLDERGLLALAVIGGTHAVIDRLAIARRWCVWYGVGFPGIWWRSKVIHAESSGNVSISVREAFEPPPPFLGVWLIILVDNTMHLTINAACLAWVAA